VTRESVPILGILAPPTGKACCQPETQSPLVLLTERPLKDPSSRKEREKDRAPVLYIGKAWADFAQEGPHEG